MHGNSWIGREDLERLYCTQELSTYKIAELYKISAPAVRYWLKRWEFNIRDKGSAQTGSHNPIWRGGPEYRSVYLYKKYAIDFKMRAGCKYCGYNFCSDALEFHHMDPKEKDFFITRGNIMSIAELQKEIDKCIVLCGNCHNELHFFIPYKNNSTQRRVWEKISSIKVFRGCCNCSYNKISGLEFHHRDKKEKLFTIGRTANLSRSMEEIMTEINKCDVFCANCHREKEAEIRALNPTKSQNFPLTIYNVFETSMERAV